MSITSTWANETSHGNLCSQFCRDRIQYVFVFSGDNCYLQVQTTLLCITIPPLPICSTPSALHLNFQHYKSRDCKQAVRTFKN